MRALEFEGVISLVRVVKDRRTEVVGTVLMGASMMSRGVVRADVPVSSFLS